MICIPFYLYTAYLYCDDTKSTEVLQGWYVAVQCTCHRNLTRSCIQLKQVRASGWKQAIAVVKFPVLILLWGARIAQWLERRTLVPFPAGAVREFSSPGSAFCADVFNYPFHTRVTAVARKRSRSFCQSAVGGLQLTRTHPTFAWSDVLWCMVVWCTQNVPRRQQFHLASRVVTGQSGWICSVLTG